MCVPEALSPALQVKTLRLLQYFPAPGDAATLQSLNDLLRKIIRGDAAASLTAMPKTLKP